jgi:hypothetical protein
VSELSTAVGQPAAAAERAPVHLGGWAQLMLFVLGLLVGAGVNSYLSPAPPPNPYAELSLIGEPPESAAVVRVLLADDARTLSRMLPGEVLQGLGQAIDPLQEIFEAKFVGGTERKGDILASYVMSGRGSQGQDFSVGVVFRVSGGKVIGVN